MRFTRETPTVKRGRALAISLIGVALAVVAAAMVSVAGAVSEFGSPPDAAPSGTTGADQFFRGYYAADEPLALAYRTIPYGSYVLEYSMDVRFFASDRRAVLECGFVDANGVIGYLENSARVEIPPTGETRKVTFSAAFQLPEITIALNCTPSRSGELDVQFRNVALGVIRR